MEENTSNADLVEEPEEDVPEAIETTTESGISSTESPDEPIVAEVAPPGGDVSGDTEPPGPTLRERLAAMFRWRRPDIPAPSTGQPETSSLANATLEEWTERRQFSLRSLFSSGAWIYALIVVLVIAALILPPISLPRRMGWVGFTRLNAENQSISHPDGITISVDPSDDVGLRVKLESIPQVEFMEGDVSSDLQAARDALPLWLEARSPFYSIDVGSRAKGPGTMEIVIPNDAEPWEKLDLYSWNGSDWEWIGATLDSEREVLVANVDSLPPSIVVMQTKTIVPAIGTISETEPDEQEAAVLTEIAQPGLFLGTDGLLLGEVVQLTNQTYESVLLIRNWQEGQIPNMGLLLDVLNDETIQETHIQEVVSAAQSRGAVAVLLDYQGMEDAQRDSFTSFVTALADALHAQNIWLELMVGMPTLGSSGWNTGPFDWASLGADTDAIIIPLPDDPAAFSESGQVSQLLTWATGQVNRYKIRVLVSSLSVDSSSEGVRYVSLEDALSPFGQVNAPDETTIEPGQEIQFTLVGQVTTITPHDAAGTYSIAYQDGDSESGTVWLGTPSYLARRLDWALRYNLGGVVVADMSSEDNLPGVLDAVYGYASAASMMEPTVLEVRWEISGPDSASTEELVSLSQPDYNWVAPEQPGDYTISAAIAGVSRGSVQMTIAEPTPEPPETLSEEEAACLQASFLADVTVPDGTQMESGEAYVKTWRLRNSGTCDWPEDTTLVLFSSQTGGPETFDVGSLTVGEEIEISLDLVAPEEDGSYSGQWNLKVGDADIDGGIVTVLIQVGEGVAVAAAPPPVVSGGTFELGGHVLNSNMLYAGQMHYAGMNWAKVQIRYAGGANDWIQASHNAGFYIQLSALGSPDMVLQGGFFESYANWVASLAAAGADAIEIWNEPNIGREWQEGSISPSSYTQLLCASYAAIKAANPSTLVISAAPAPTGWFGGCGPNGCDDLPFLQGMYNAGAAACMDYIGAHHNAGATSPSARNGHPADPASVHHSWYFLPQTEAYYNTFGGTRQLFYTEMGYVTPEGTCSNGLPSNFGWANGTTLAQQGAWLAEAVQLSIQTGMVRCVIVWNIDFNRSDCGDCDPSSGDCDPQASYGIIRPGGGCPTCDTLHAILGTR